MKKRFKKIYIEITNVCNLNCDFCPKTKRKLGFMSLDLFERALLESKPLAEEITLHLMGEPLLHPKINEIIKLAEQNDIRINLTTNATLTKKHSQLLLNKTIRRINFSVHSLKSNYSEEDQEKYLLEVIDFTKLARIERDDLVIIYRLWNIENSSNKKILNVIEREFDIVFNKSKKLEVSNTISTKIKGNAYINYDTSFDWPDPKKEIRNETGYCHGLSTHIGILVDGTVVPCCLDNNGNIPLGNILDLSIEEILKLPRAKNMLNGFRNRKIVEDMCKKCTYLERLNRNKKK